MSRKTATVAAVGALVLLFASACGAVASAVGNVRPGGMMGGGGMTGSGPAGSITVRLMDWSVVPSQSSIQAGKVTFHATHPMMDMMSGSQGGRTHALTVARKNDDGTYDVLGSVWDIGLGQSKDLTLDLAPGNYELQCNVVEELGTKTVSHYKQGMHTPFTVTG